MKARLLRYVSVAAAGALALGLAGCSGSSDSGSGDPGSSDKKVMDVNFGYITDLNGTALLAIADSEKLWEKNGLKPNLRTFNNGPLQIQALGTKDLDYGYIGNGAFWLPMSGKAELACMIATSQADRVIAQPGIKTIQDLKGKKVGVPEVTSGDTILELALAKAGMSASDIQRVPMDPSTIVSAFSSKQIDAAGMWYPNVETIKKQVPDLVELAKDSDFEDQMAFPSAIVMRKGLAKENPELAKRVEKVLYEALKYRAENPDKTVELVAKMANQKKEDLAGEAKYIKPLTPEDQIKLWDDGTLKKWLNNMGDFFVKNKKVDKGALLKPEDYFRIDLLKAAK